PDRIEARQGGGFRHAHVRRGCIDLLERGSDSGVVIERVLKRLLERECRRGALRAAPLGARCRGERHDTRQNHSETSSFHRDSVPLIGSAEQLAAKYQCRRQLTRKWRVRSIIGFRLLFPITTAELSAMAQRLSM